MRAPFACKVLCLPVVREERRQALRNVICAALGGLL